MSDVPIGDQLIAQMLELAAQAVESGAHREYPIELIAAEIFAQLTFPTAGESR